MGTVGEEGREGEEEKENNTESESASRSVVSATPRTIVCQAPLSMDFFRQEYWSG